MPSISNPPRIAAIHDLSCMGRCALTVVMPTLSVMGYQTVPLPTALLSTHTGGFQNLHFRDLTSDMEAIATHFSQLELSFRAIYTGFLGSEEQIDTVSRFIDRFGRIPDESGRIPIVLIDPVMGDDGALYSTYTQELMLGMRHLAEKADILTPNITEACFLTDTPYQITEHLSERDACAFVETILDKLAQFCRGKTVITGIRLSDGTLANIGREIDGRVFCVRRAHQSLSYPGTGDLFASVLLGTYLAGKSFAAACNAAADFCAEVIHDSACIASPVCYGVALESHLWKLAKKD